MKKALFSFAIVAAGLLVASCGSKSGNAADAPATDDAAEVADAPAAAPAEAAAAENDHLTVTVPAGWVLEADNISDRSMYIKAPEFGEWESVNLFFNDTATDAAEQAGMCIQGSEDTRQAAEDVTFGNLTFKQVKFINSGDTNCMLFATATGGVLEVTLSDGVPLDAASVKSLLESVSFK